MARLRIQAFSAFLAAMALSLGLLSAGAVAAPSGHDFGQDLPPIDRKAASSGGLEEGGDTHRSAVIQAPERFDMAGLEGELRHYELRGRTAGGEWTDWAETANGDPVWFGGMDELQVRAHDWVPSGRIHYVAISQPAPQPVAKHAGGSGMPDVVSRREWGANQDSGGCKPSQAASYGRVKAAAVHHTVSAVDYSEGEAPGLVLGICRYHRYSNGWDDIGYNALVDRFGNIYAGRDGGLGRAVIGAHMQGYNAQTTGVAVIGTHGSVPASREALRGAARWLAWKLPEHGRDTKGTARLVSAGGDANRYPEGTRVNTKRIIGHRRTGYTECPGDSLDAQLPQLRRKVQRRIDGDGTDGSSGEETGGIGG